VCTVLQNTPFAFLFCLHFAFCVQIEGIIGLSCPSHWYLLCAWNKFMYLSSLMNDWYVMWWMFNLFNYSSWKESSIFFVLPSLKLAIQHTWRMIDLSDVFRIAGITANLNHCICESNADHIFTPCCLHDVF
jgi:hypothetical protein